MANIFMSGQPANVVGPAAGFQYDDEDSAGMGSARWNRQDYSWDPFNMTADSVKSAKAGLALPATAPAVNTRSGGRTKEVNHAPAGRAKGPLCCQVETCRVNLETSKEYHIRYRICETCLKTSSIVRDGERERFCQQCGRFHPLEDFDGDKRSCRVRLQRHNNRRRKKVRKEEGAPKKGDKASKAGKAPAAKRLKSDGPKQSKMLDDSHKALEETLNDLLGVAEGSVGISGSANSAQDMVHDGVTSVMSSHIMEDASMQTDTAAYSSGAYPQEFFTELPPSMPFMPKPPHASSSCQMEGLDSINNMQDYRMVPDLMPSDLMLNPGLGLDAPSLPSFAPQNHMLHPMAPQPQAQPQPGMLPTFSLPGYSLQVVPAGLTFEQLANAASHRNMLGGMATSQYSGMDTIQLQHTGLFSQTPQGPAPVILAMLPTPQPAAPQYTQLMNMSNLGGGPSIAHSLDSLDIARNVISNNTLYEHPMQHMRVSAKINGVTPDHLPRDLKSQLEGLVHPNPNRMEGYIRVGCVHLTVKFALTKDQANAVQGLGARDAACLLLNRAGSSPADMWHRGVVLVQVRDEVALIRDGLVTHVLDGQASAGVFPNMEKVSPLALLASGPSVATLHGSNLLHDDNMLVGYCQGQEVLEQRVPPNTKSPMKLQLPRNRRNGAVQLCVVRGCYQSRFKPVLVIDDEAVVKEINQLEDSEVAAGIDVDAFLMDLDSILELLNAYEVRSSGSREMIRSYDASDYELLIETACRIFLLATSKGWPAIAKLVQPVMSLYTKSLPEVITRVYKYSMDQLSLLHLAVRSGNPKMVEMLLQWSSRLGYEFAASTPGPQGLTPLHLAVLLPDGGEVAALLTVLCVDGQSAWAVGAADGSTPFQLAQRVGVAGKVQASITAAMSKRADALQASDAAAAAAAEGEDSEESEVEVEDDVEFEIDSVTGEVINLDGISLDEECEEEEDGDEEAGADEPVKHAEPVKQATEAQMPSSMEKVAPPVAGLASKAVESEGASSKAGSASGKPAAFSDGKPGCGEFSDHFPSKQALPAPHLAVSSKGQMLENTAGFPELDDKPLKVTQTKRARPYTESQVVSAYNMGVAPTVFDRLSAIRSAGFVSTIGVTTLILRYYVDYFMD